MGIRRLGRPTGFNFPVGLSIAFANTVVDYLVVAGGGGGVGGRREGLVGARPNYIVRGGTLVEAIQRRWPCGARPRYRRAFGG